MRSLCERGFVVACLALISGSTAWAEFVINESPDGQKLIVNKSSSDGFSFSGKTSEKDFEPTVYIKSDGNLNLWDDKERDDSKEDKLPTDIFIAVDDNKSVGFSEFSMRGQLDPKAEGMLEMIVTNNFGKIFDFIFTGLGKYEDFQRIGVIANSKGEYIKSIELKSFFKSEKQFEFSHRYLTKDGGDGKGSDKDNEYGENTSDGSGEEGEGGGGGGVNPNISAVPEPSTFALLSIGGIALVISAFRGRRNDAATV